MVNEDNDFVERWAKKRAPMPPSEMREHHRRFATRQLSKGHWTWETARAYLGRFSALVGTEEKPESPLARLVLRVRWPLGAALVARDQVSITGSRSSR